MKSLNKISLIFAVILIAGLALFVSYKLLNNNNRSLAATACFQYMTQSSCVGAGCQWNGDICLPKSSTPSPTPSNYVPPAGSCPGFKAEYDNGGANVVVRTHCYGDSDGGGSATHIRQTFQINPEITCVSTTKPRFEGNNCRAVAKKDNDNFLSTLLEKLVNAAGAVPAPGDCRDYGSNVTCSTFYRWQIYHAEVFTVNTDHPQDNRCVIHLALWDKNNQEVQPQPPTSYCGEPSNTTGRAGITVNADHFPAAKVRNQVDVDGNWFDIARWEGYTKFWAKKLDFKTFTANGGSGNITINKGDAVRLAWDVRNATPGMIWLFIGDATCTPVPGGSPCPFPRNDSYTLSNSSGSLTVYPQQTTKFYIYANGPSGEGMLYIISDPIQVTVTEATPTPTPTSQASVDIKADGKDGPISINSGSSVNLSWTSSNLGTNPSCTASDSWSGAKTTSGSENTGALTSAKIYTLTCSGSKGTASDSVRVNMAGVGQGTIVVRARLDGEAWSGNLSYTLRGPETITGTAVRKQHSNVTVGNYIITSGSGGPSNALLDSVTPASSLSLSAGGTITFTLNFKTITGPTHKECNASKRCATVVGEGADTCTDDVSCGWTGDTHKECNASKRCVAVSGEGADTCTDDVSCGWTGDTHKECNASKQCVDVSGVGADQCINDTSCNLPGGGFVCNFSWSPESPKAKSAIDFFDYTQTPEGTTLSSWNWTFEDGTPANSFDQSPGSVIFNSAGEKTVTLQATNSDGDTCTLDQTITVQSLNPKWIEVIPK